MKKFALLCSIIIFCFYVSPSHAQFWRKKKKEKTIQINEDEKSKETKEEVIPKKFKYPESKIKDRYRIDVLIPLNINNLIDEDDKPIYETPPPSMKNNIHFYEGIKMAADSLNDLGYKLDLYIHDVNNIETNGFNLIKNADFKQSDLIIGYLQSAEIPPIANFAKENHINFISALSPSDAGISNNPYFILIQPKLATHIEELVNFSKEKFKNSPRFIYYSKENSVQNESYNQLKKALANEKVVEIDWTKDISTDSLVQVFDRNRINVVYVNILSPSSAENILKKLATIPKEYRFAILGMPSWKSIPKINTANEFANLHIYFTNPFYFDIKTGSGKLFNTLYQEKHGNKASELTFRGFETLFWAAKLLKDKGTIFNEHLNNPIYSIFTEYSVLPYKINDELQYLENKNLYIYHYFNGYYNIE